MNKNSIIYNLILIIKDTYDTINIDNQSFIDYICEESGLDKTEYREIMNLED